jgi:hypothetical protein
MSEQHLDSTGGFVGARHRYGLGWLAVDNIGEDAPKAAPKIKWMEWKDGKDLYYDR